MNGGHCTARNNARDWRKSWLEYRRKRDEAEPQNEEEPMTDEKSFRDKLQDLINTHSMESGSNTPDFILAEFLADSLRAFDKATQVRARWYANEIHEFRVLNCLEPGLPIFPKPFKR